MTVGELLARRARRDGDREAVIAPAERWTYARFDARVDRVAAALVAAGVGAGERVAVVARNGADYLALYYAAARVGAILAGVNWRLAAPEIAHVLDDCRPRLVLCGAEFAPQTATANEAGVPLMTLGAATTDALPRFESFVERAGSFSAQRVSPDRPLALCYTSGTTGRAKGAVLTHAQLVAAAETIGATVDYRLHDTNLVATPLFHVGGLSFATAFALRGARVALAPAWVPDDILATIERERVQHFFAVPAMLAALLDAPRFASADLASVRWVMTGAAPLPVALIGRYHARGIPLLQSYGATETAGPATCVDPERLLEKAGSIGRAFVHTDVRVVTARGAPAAVDERGELQVRGAHVFAGYWNQPEASAAAFADGWLLTGDIGYRDRDGYFYLVDRKKEVIISGGENVYPAEVEQVLAEHPGIAEVGVVGAADARWGEVVCAIVVPRSGAAIDLESVRAHCRGRLASFKLPARLIVREQPLERNATGKILKQALRELAAAD
jgi:fatty-acyl-CoA synthase